MNDIIAAIILSLSEAGGIEVPPDEHPITWVFAECRAIEALTDWGGEEYYLGEGYKLDREWYEAFWNIAAITFDNTHDVSNVGNGRSNAKGKVEKDKLLGRLNKGNWDEKMLACGKSYRAMTEAILPFSKY